MKDLKVMHYRDDTYQVVRAYTNDNGNEEWDNLSILYQSNLSNCEAYIRMVEEGYLDE